MSDQSTASSKICPDCGGPKYKYAKFCKLCANKGKRNPRFGAKLSAEIREKIRLAALRRPRKPRNRYSQSVQSGREFAERWIELPDLCERCHVKKPVDRHHQDGNTQNNSRENILCVCRRCHQDIDGRVDRLIELAKDRRKETHCQRGHPFDEENSYWTKKGGRTCKACRRMAVRKYYKKKKEELSKRLFYDDAPLFSQEGG
jgi:hypothetical protein